VKPPPQLLLKIYRTLLDHFGHRKWWPAETPFEVIVGAILTQNTSWKNVEKAIQNLKNARALNIQTLYRMPHRQLARLIRPAGYFNVKAERLKNFLNFLFKKYQADLPKLFAAPLAELRTELLLVKGIGPETADSILLYAAQKPSFVVDTYTKRIFSRHGFFLEDSSYEDVQAFFMKRLPLRAALFNDYHAQIVKVGNSLCRRTRPLCQSCPLEFLFKIRSLKPSLSHPPGVC
jgi:endonuclease-3 related protein